MQKCTWFIIYLFCFNVYLQAEEPLLVLLLMVKNEAQAIEATLKPFLKAGLQDYLILDTGSTDDTIKIAQKLFKKYKISHGHIIEQPFVNFAVSRNYAIESAEKIFPHAVFFLMIDAEWSVHNVKGLLQFCEKYQNHNATIFYIKRCFSLHDATDYGNYLFRAHKSVRYSGAVHECIDQIADVQVPDDIFIAVNSTSFGREKSFRRWHRDLDILLKEHEKDPANLHTIFYLGQTYFCLQKIDQALFWYGKRCMARDNSEEKYQACYRIALIYQTQNNWLKALPYFFKAHDLSPMRKEPLVWIAKYYMSKLDYQAAFLLAKYILNICLPEQNSLCISPKVYDFEKYDILNVAAFSAGEYQIGMQAALKALAIEPENIRLQEALKLYEKKLQHCDCQLFHRKYWCKWCNGSFWLSRPAWFNNCCLSLGCNQSNRLNLSQGIFWREWVGPLTIESMN
jgi:glycosyltransferase involved in cell wall biosynthesis